MTLDKFWLVIADVISEQTRQQFSPSRVMPVGGGDINENYFLEGEDQKYFVKINRRHYQLFAAEAQALEQIQATHTIRVPAVVAQGITQQFAFLVLEALPLSANQDASQFTLGEQLASLHRVSASKLSDGLYGWPSENFIGSTPQYNQPRQSWADFWHKNRLQPQLTMAYTNGFSDVLRAYEKELLARSDILLAEHHPPPSLVHGDLWSGNAGCLQDGTPVIFDPASYYGDREVDLAMTELFGGFSAGFYRGYTRSWPLSADYEKRKPLYNLYHMLNHLNVFGGGYLGSCVRLINNLLT